jgi:hypothetical protein
VSRPFPELVKDYEADPSSWEVVETSTVPSSNKRNRGGLSVQERLRHKQTGEEVIRHTLLKPNGAVFAPPHLRPDWK